MGVLKTRALGKGGIKVTEIGMGLWGADGDGWGRTDDRAVLDAIDLALDAGVNFFDTSDVYGRSMTQLAVQFVLAHPVVTTSILQAQKHAQQIRETAQAESLPPLTEDEVATCAMVTSPGSRRKIRPTWPA